jgi:hypothetical protein
MSTVESLQKFVPLIAATLVSVPDALLIAYLGATVDRKEPIPYQKNTFLKVWFIFVLVLNVAVFSYHVSHGLAFNSVLAVLNIVYESYVIKLLFQESIDPTGYERKLVLVLAYLIIVKYFLRAGYEMLFQGLVKTIQKNDVVLELLTHSR